MEPTEHNRRAWDEIHRRRSEALAGELGLPDPVRRSLANLTGKRVLHLQCATGESTAELAELGAVATGVDISEEALEVARERNPSIVWVQADVQALPQELRRGRFDLVYTATGVLVWLHDLNAWATGIVAALRPGGDFLLYEEHPVAMCVDPMMHWREDYFDDSILVDTGWTHFQLEGEPPVEEKHERFWRLGQVVTAVARAGLTVRALEEYPSRKSEFRHLDARVPGDFLLYAVKPA
ncbi:MAG TPA: class I SAM-dependent methyltransferase [Gaiellaceae bacterium]|nr:class I SAM-dependent methyltransferase [Gaiellaceae bacterium]